MKKDIIATFLGFAILVAGSFYFLYSYDDFISGKASDSAEDNYLCLVSGSIYELTSDTQVYQSYGKKKGLGSPLNLSTGSEFQVIRKIPGTSIMQIKILSPDGIATSKLYLNIKESFGYSKIN